MAVALKARLDPTESVGFSERYAFWVDGEAYTIAADDGQVTVERGEPEDPAVRVQIGLDAVLQIGMGTMTMREAREAGRTRIEGDRDAVARYSGLYRHENAR